MTTLAADRYMKEYVGRDYVAPVYQSSLIYKGSLVCQNATGYAVKGSTSTALRALGVAQEQKDNTSGSSGDLDITYRKGVYPFFNSSSSDEITSAEKDEVCYIVDDQTVAKTSGGGTRSIAGRIRGIDPDTLQVLVEVGYISNVDGDLVAANNLSDVAAVATARANLGANLLEKDLGRVILNANGTTYIPCGAAGVITEIISVIEGALTGGDPTLTFSIGSTAITDGVITIANSGSAAGDVDYCSPSAARTVAKRNYIKCVVAANSQSNAVYAKIVARIET